MNTDKIKVVELFAGIGGFRAGLELSSTRYTTIWANQWEPEKKAQHAFNCYVSHYGVSQNHTNEDIANAKKNVPPHNLLVGGFPCQDYSVARTGAKGIEGQKGVLWWHIRDIIMQHRPSFIILENVDRLLKSPGSQRGRDFGVILRCFSDMGYGAEWRIINAAEYGYAQRRRRVYILAFNKTTSLYKELTGLTCVKGNVSLLNRLHNDGFFSSIFQVKDIVNKKKCSESWIDELKYSDLSELSKDFTTPLYNTGIMINSHIVTCETTPVDNLPITIKEIRHKKIVDEKYFLNGSLEKWQYLKGAKKIPRIRPNGEPYFFSEGGMCFPDDLNKPARTILTSESSVNRSSHVIEDAITGRLRLLTPIECERLNGFPDNWTNTGMPEKFRYFTMGNSLVVPIVERIGSRLLDFL